MSGIAQAACGVSSAHGARGNSAWYSAAVSSHNDVPERAAFGDGASSESGRRSKAFACASGRPRTASRTSS